MSIEKDYYNILRVLPTAEDVVIRAAYRALAMIYHPDRMAEAGAENAEIMAEINEAYATLSDPSKRRDYDAKHRNNQTSMGADYKEYRDGPASTDSQMEKDWHIALSYYPDLKKSEANLRKLSTQLGLRFRIVMLDSKKFTDRGIIADRLRDEFLTLHFGKNQEIKDLARELIEGGHKTVAQSLNEAMKVLGDNPDVRRITEKLWKDFPNVRLASLITRYYSGGTFYEAYIFEIISILGGKVTVTSKWYQVEAGYHIEIDGQVIDIKIPGLNQWAIEFLLPLARKKLSEKS